MDFVNIPNLPVHNVKAVLIDGRAGCDVVDSLKELGVRVIKTQRHPGVHEAVSFHPDMFLHHVGGNRIVYAPETKEAVLEELAQLGFELVRGLTELFSEYPRDIAYNVARVGNFALHNLNYTDRVLRAELESRHVKFIHVKQGYAKCSITVVDDSSLITADVGIARAAAREGLEVLLIEPDANIVLPGFDRGFIGGSTGKLGKKRLAFSGSIDNLKSKKAVKEFIYRKGFELIYLSGRPLTDIGSILPIVEQ